MGLERILYLGVCPKQLISMLFLRYLNWTSTHASEGSRRGIPKMVPVEIVSWCISQCPLKLPVSAMIRKDDITKILHWSGLHPLPMIFTLHMSYNCQTLFLLFLSFYSITRVWQGLSYSGGFTATSCIFWYTSKCCKNRYFQTKSSTSIIV